MNRHLNIFNFFNGGGLDYLEDNLSRGFALCLKYDSIDLQNRTSDLEGFSDIIALPAAERKFSNLIRLLRGKPVLPKLMGISSSMKPVFYLNLSGRAKTARRS
jgi:hypothetical protein